jgi:hypothetical protein
MARLDYSKMDRCLKGHDLKLPGALVQEGPRQRCLQCRRERDQKRQLTEAQRERDNMLRKERRQRKAATHCRQGHKLTGENLLLVTHYNNGQVERRCRICNRKRDRKRSGEPSLLECQAEMVRTRQLIALDILYDRAATHMERTAIREARRRLEVG